MAVNLNSSESTDVREFASTSRGNSVKMSVTVPATETPSNTLEDSSPDALKNTPSNIARLEDIIEHSEARRKYLAQTKSPSDGEDVRWYFCKVPLAPRELAASVPVTEIVGKSDYFRFSMRDSLALEASFLQREEELLSAWWKEYAECSEGPGGTGSSVSAYGSESKSSAAAEGVSRQNLSGRGLGSTEHHDSTDQIYSDAEETVGVPVKGGLYEVDLWKRHCFPVYWHGENRRVLRGHWFARKGGLEWLPLREDVAEQLEVAYRNRVWHRRTFQPSGQFAARVDLQGATKGLHALFTGEDKNWEAWLGVDAYGISLVIGVRGDGIKLRRGFAPSGSPQPTQDELRQRKEEEMDDYCSQVPVRHLVFMVHGIGQRLEKANLVDDVATFRHIVASLAEQHLTTYQRNAQRVLFIPCQWRRSLKLQGEAAVEKITLEGVRALRNMLSATVHDVLYYMSPIYCQDIIDSVSNQLNRLYGKFLKRNPGYDGKVSIYGHSLGSVLSYDILCHQDTLSSFFPSECINQSAVQNEDEQFDKVNHSSRYMVDVHTLDSKQEEETLTDGGSSSHKRTVEPKQESESVNVLQEATIELKKEEGTLNAPQDAQMDSRWEAETADALTNSVAEETRITETINPPQEDTVWSKEEFETVKASPEATMVLKQEPEAPNIGHKHIESNEDALSETVGDNTCNNSLKVIELLREEVASLKAKIMKLEGRDIVNNITYGIVNDVGQSLSQMENKQDASGISTNVCRPLHSTSRQEDVSSVSVVGVREGNLPPRTSKLSKPGSVKKNTDPTVESGKHYTPYIKYTKLDFKVETFFAVGSPLGVFLALRNVRIGTGDGQEYWQDEGITEEMPSCQQMLNIFHPYDPVAYRLEPLVCKEYIEKRPVFIPYHKGGKRLHIGMQQFCEDLSARSKAFVKHLNFLGGHMANKDKDAEDDAKKKQVKTYGSMIMDRLTGGPDGRLDYMLQDATFEHQYISAISSHTSYWRDLDTALFILKHLYREIPPEPPQANQGNIPEKRQSEDQVSSVDQTCRQDSLDGEVAFTFSGKEVINTFSSLKRKSKSIVKA